MTSTYLWRDEGVKDTLTEIHSCSWIIQVRFLVAKYARKSSFKFQQVGIDYFRPQVSPESKDYNLYSGSSSN